MKKSLFFIFCYLFIFIIGGEFIFYFFENILEISYEDNAEMIVAYINFSIYIVLLIIGLLLFKKDIKTDFDLYKHSDNKLLRIVSSYGFVLLAGIIAQVILMNIGMGDTDPGNQQGIEHMLSSKYFILVAISILIGPITEELVYRKSMFTILYRFKLNKYIILFITSFLFGLIHVISFAFDDPYELFFILPYFAKGWVFGELYIRSRNNIFLPTLVHILNNFIAVILLIIIGLTQ